MKRHIPNLLTILNLLSGVMAIIMTLDGHLSQAALFIALGAIFDLFDGMVARLLAVDSEIGKQLDSLADMVSFGLAPALIARELILKGMFVYKGEIALEGLELLIPYVPFFMVACSALRLAKFNIDESQAVDFKGLPTPANALFWLSIPLGSKVYGESALSSFFQNPWVLCTACLVLSLLMLSRIPLLSMKLDREDKLRLTWQFVFLVFSGLLFVLLRFASIPFIIVLYLLLSLIRNTTRRDEIQS